MSHIIIKRKDAHTVTRTHEYIDYSQPNLQTTNRDLRRRKTAVRSGKHGRSTVLEKRSLDLNECFGKKEVSSLDLNECFGRKNVEFRSE